VRFALENGVELDELTVPELRQFGEEFGADFFDAVALEATLDCHDVIGGTARARVRQALDETLQRVKALRPEGIHASAEGSVA
ncbi:MAG: argininosuccinate lyase, partial [Terracidiphilus sp.]